MNSCWLWRGYWPLYSRPAPIHCWWRWRAGVVTKILRALIDPNAAPARVPPREDRDVRIAANNGHILAFDNPKTALKISFVAQIWLTERSSLP